MEFPTWLAFLLATILISITPGAGAVNTMATAIKSGVRKTLPAILGLQVGLLIHLLVVAAGLGALLAASEVLFSLVKWAGVTYLIYLGISKWRESDQETMAAGEKLSHKRSFASAVVVNLTNPKAIVFLAAFLPQFLATEMALWPQYLVLGSTMVAVDILVMLGFASFAVRLLPLIKKHGKLQNRLFGSMFIGCGALLATSQR